jgi:hypothetical protein
VTIIMNDDRDTTLTVSVMQEKWDYLIVLDACRYDYFERLYEKYLNGNLEKRISIGTSTAQWRDKSFPDYYEDVIYISANPYINSLVPVRGFLAKDHFHKTFDLWLEDWDEDKGTVLPGIVTERTKLIADAYPHKRVIIHYTQPHEPYIGEGGTGPGYKPPAPGGILQGLRGEPWIVRKIMNLSSGVFYWLGIRGNKLIWNIRRFIGVQPAGPMDAVRREFGDEGLRKAYEENLKAVLPHVKELVAHLSGRIIITADHGEMLGEDGCYCHWSRATNKQLREIPWLVIDKGPKDVAIKEQKQQSQSPESSISDLNKKKLLQERLTALGY